MKELWDIITSPGVLPFSILLLVVSAYWIIFALGLVDIEALDVVLEIETDSDVNSIETSPGVLASPLRFLNANDIPVIVILSIIIVLSWLYVAIATVLLENMALPWKDSLIALGCFILAIISTKLITLPLRPVFRSLKSDEKADPIIGKTGTVRSHELTTERGQIRVEHRGSDALLNARLSSNSAHLIRGDEVVIFSYDEPSGIYIVKSTTHSNA